MIDPTPREQAAMNACLKSFGEAAGEIGFDKPLGQYSKVEALQIIRAIVSRYLEAMNNKSSPPGGFPDDDISF